MKLRNLLALALVLALPLDADAGRGRPSGFSYWLGKTNSGIQTGAATRFYTPLSTESPDAATTEASREFTMPTAGTVSELKFWLDGDVGAAGSSLVVTLRKNGADTRVACTITGGTGTELYCDNLVDEVAFAAGDRVALQFVTAGTPNAALPGWILRFDPDTHSHFVLVGQTHTTVNVDADRYVQISGASGATLITAEASARMVMPLDGRLAALQLRASVAIAAGTRTMNVFKNGVLDQTLECTLTGGAVACGDSVGVIPFRAGDTLSLHIVGSGTATTAGLVGSLLVIPDVPGEFAVFSATNTPTNSATRYYGLEGFSGSGETTEATFANFVPPLLLLRSYVACIGAPGATASWRVALRTDLVVDSPATCTVTDPALSCLVQHPIGTEWAQRIAWSITGTNSPTATRITIGTAVKAR